MREREREKERERERLANFQVSDQANPATVAALGRDPDQHSSSHHLPYFS